MTAAPGEEQTDHVRVVAEQGRICALATHCARDLQDRAAAHPELFSAKPFDATLFNAVSLANAFGSPDDPHTALRIANRTSLWIFALDWLIDYRAKKREDVEALVARCTAAVTDGTPDGDGQDGEGAALARFLVEIRDLLATAPAFAAHRDVWLDELRRMLEAMALEWEWKASRAETGASTRRSTTTSPTPTTSARRSSTPGTGSSPPARPPSTTSTRCWRRAVRCSGCSGSSTTSPVQAGRHLGRPERDAARRRRGHRQGEDRPARGELPEAAASPARPMSREAVYLERQIGYSVGFYGGADYWGDL